MVKKILIPLFLILLIAFFIEYDLSQCKRSFHSEEWKSAINDNESIYHTRWKMIVSLRLKHRLKNKTKPEIIELLGPPDADRDNEFEYYLGPTGWWIETGSLDIVFKNGVCKKVSIVRG